MMYDDVDFPLSGFVPQFSPEKGREFETFFLVGDLEIGGSGQVA